MKLETVEYRSSLFRETVAYDVLLPEGAGPFPVVYFHHGLGNDRSTPTKRTRLQELAASSGLMLVMPDAADGWFADDPRRGGLPWETHLANELVEQVDRRFPTIAERRGRGQAGFSMGGYGAMMLAMRHPDRFSAVYAISGSFHFGHAFRPDRPERTPFMKAVAPPGGKYDLFRLAESLGDRGPRPAIHFCVGTEDHLLESNRQLHRHFEETELPHLYEEIPGRHRWEFVDQRLPTMLDFMKYRLEPSGDV